MDIWVVQVVNGRPLKVFTREILAKDYAAAHHRETGQKTKIAGPFKLHSPLDTLPLDPPKEDPPIRSYGATVNP